MLNLIKDRLSFCIFYDVKWYGISISLEEFQYNDEHKGKNLMSSYF